ncbi:MAG TPA: phospholipid carrier-dependent glycosyltransferase [Anaerolineae bacterium]|nr:phospholipid carrier-dependent glycosyltransferase [Anaerolineae bacterium]
MTRSQHRWTLIGLLFVTFTLRVAFLTELPPGLTHDEANHGREAIGILDGILLFYFPLNYGSEPLYSYTVAALMAAVGENILALRLVTAYAGTLTVAATYAFTRRHFTPTTALTAAAFLGLNFWPLATSRQALRVGLLPFLTLLAILPFTELIRRHTQPQQTITSRTQTSLTLAFGVAITLTLHNYLAARILWLIFPAFLLYLLIFPANRHLFSKLWRPTLAGLLLAGLLVIPMFVYINNHPEVATRLDMLDGPLQALQRGDPRPILNNTTGALLALVVPGQGDSFLAYNVNRRPTLDFITAAFFLLGLATLWPQRRSPLYAFLAIWLLVGLAPSLITGPTANTTRNMGAQPVIYIIAALGLQPVCGWIHRKRPPLATPSLVLIFALITLITTYDYFITWGQNPDVRAAYQPTLVNMLAFNQADNGFPPADAVSTVYPGPAHDPSITLVYDQDLARNGRWLDARSALVFPDKNNPLHLLSSAATPLHPLFTLHATSLAQQEMRPTDLDPHFNLYQINPTPLIPPAPSIDANFNDAVTLYHATWTAATYPPNSVAPLITVWPVTNPARLGPIVPPINTTDINIFTHILNPDDTIRVQTDLLAAPSWSWQAGDYIIQIHDFWLPPDTPPATYTSITGLYDRLSGTRLTRPDGSSFATLPALTVAP